MTTTASFQNAERARPGRCRVLTTRRFPPPCSSQAEPANYPKTCRADLRVSLFQALPTLKPAVFAVNPAIHSRIEPPNRRQSSAAILPIRGNNFSLSLVFLRPREWEKVPEGRMRVVGMETNPVERAGVRAGFLLAPSMGRFPPRPFSTSGYPKIASHAG